MNSLTEDLQFLKDLQQEMNTQDNDVQASPRFWSVGDYRWVGCPDGNAERYSVYFPSEASASTINDYIENLDREDLEDEAREALDEVDTEDHSAVFDWIQEHVDEDAYMFGERKEHFVRDNTMFLTKAEAKQHIELNHYHYTNEAHTYAMTAWRAPKVERLLKILSECDFDQLLQQINPLIKTPKQIRDEIEASKRTLQNHRKAYRAGTITMEALRDAAIDNESTKAALLWVLGENDRYD